MSDAPNVVRKQVEITNELGLHVRPALKFVKLAGRFQSEIRVIHQGKVVNGKGILDLTLLAAECGTVLELEAKGSDASEAMEALVDLVESQFGEDDEGDDLLDPMTAAVNPVCDPPPSSPSPSPKLQESEGTEKETSA